MKWYKLLSCFLFLFLFVGGPVNGNIFATSLSDSDFTTLKEEPYKPFFDEKIWADFRNPHEYVEAAYKEMLARSQQVQSEIQQATDSHKPFVVDIVGIGAGANNVQAFNALKQSKPHLRMLIFEANKTMSIFDELGRSFRINSVETEEFTANFFSACPLQVRDFNIKKECNVDSQVISDLIKTGFAYAHVPILFSQPVVTVEEQPSGAKWCARYKVTTKTGSSVYANHVIASTGMGEPRIAVGDASTQQLIAEQEEAARQAFEKGDLAYVPGIETVDSYLKRAAAKINKGEEPILESQNITIAVIGCGDGGNIAIEGLTGLYEGLNPTGKPGANIVWVGLHRDKKDFLDQFSDEKSKFPPHLNKVRKERYAAIAPLFDEGRITTAWGFMKRIEKMQELGPDGKAITTFRITVEPPTGEVAQVKVDRIVLSTGYENKIEQLFKLNNTESERVFADTSNCTLDAQLGGVFPVGRKFKDGDVWVIGVATDKWAERIFELEHLKFSRGGYLDILGTRSATVGRMIAKEVTSIVDSSNCAEPLQLKADESASSNTSFEKSISVSSQGALSVAQIQNKLEMCHFLEQFRISDGKITPLQIDFEDKGSQIQMKVKGLDKQSNQLLMDQFKQNTCLCKSFEVLLSFHPQLSVTIYPRSEDGSFRLENLCYTY